jgi:coenzyme F420 biosynthesis associated uncharacterized protein
MTSSSPRWKPDRRFLTAGLLAGAALGAWVGSRPRTALAPGREPAMIDWEQARTIAINMNREAALTAPERSRLDTYYRDLVRRCVPIVSQYTGVELPSTLERTFAFDRVDWINANIAGFRQLFAPLEALNPELDGQRTVASELLGGVNRRVISAELGVLLGYLARRVLGQYDLALLGREPVTTGKLYYVEPNIRSVEQTLKLPGEDFRMWLALHETTHAFEFEAHPWLRDYFNGLLEGYFELLRQDAEVLKRRGMKGLGIFVDRVRDRRADGAWLEALMTPEQRVIFDKLQATMCIIEGYSNHVMNAVGKSLLPSYAEIARKFELRQKQRTMAEQLFAQITGLNMKLEQYRLGEAFINRIVAERDHATARRVWTGPEFLPTMEEIRQPERWLARTDALVGALPPAAGAPVSG